MIILQKVIGKKKTDQSNMGFDKFRMQRFKSVLDIESGNALLQSIEKEENERKN